MTTPTTQPPPGTPDFGECECVYQVLGASGTQRTTYCRPCQCRAKWQAGAEWMRDQLIEAMKDRCYKRALHITAHERDRDRATVGIVIDLAHAIPIPASTKGDEGE